MLKLSGNCPSCAIIGKEIASYAGTTPPTSVSLNFGSVYPAALQAIKDADGQTGNGGTVRIVFRVKTNRGFDDENGGNPSAAYDSGTRGAAIVDNVVVNGWAAANGDFEAANSINNDTAVDATDGLEVDREAPGRVLPRALGDAGLRAGVQRPVRLARQPEPPVQPVRQGR